MVGHRCYYYGDVKVSSYNQAQNECAKKFSKGGRLFEPLFLEVNNLVLTTSREFVSGTNYFYIGVKRSEIIGSAFKLVSRGITVPYAINWCCGTSSTDQCIYARNDAKLSWDDAHCSLSWYYICESV